MLISPTSFMLAEGHRQGVAHAAATGCLARPRPPWLLPCRQKAAEKAKMLHAAGQVKEAATAFSQTVTITADMAHELVLQLQRLGIAFVVSPYEADSQLAFLSLVRPSAAKAPVLVWACWHCQDRSGQAPWSWQALHRSQALFR